MNHIAATDDLILVGHSSASPLVAELATKLPARAIIIVDGDIPPPHGRASPVRPVLHDFIRNLAGAEGMLPVWSRWFARDPQRAALIGLDILARDPLALAQFEDGLPTMRVDWFDDTIDLLRWDHIPAGFVQASPIYDHATTEALRRGWPVERLNGTHLHPTLCPDEMAGAILSLAHRLRQRS
ncbi:alpha/beta hydrolase [Bradyrhizobium ontarionense]|uniref:Alpha/beta hydrolase n=1 Tax=Bradyrhizobium ontarionense TaxID=2898149 RepID=A0ABY3RHW4_9BRAD|nr:alpha/beta hydrolase [Bradyrhizobium sp. A19]UFZ07066.1 alpha/beta hydrolase [Bradyrhizobium sp. A19]